MATQRYKTYRFNLISKEELLKLNAPRPAVMVCDTIVRWAFIFAAWATVAVNPTWWTVSLAVPMIGIMYYGLKIIAHDGSHRRLFKSRSLNDLWCDLFLLGPVGAINRLNRRNHIEHHTKTCLPDDPDRHKYDHEGKETTVEYLFFLTGLSSFVQAARNVFLRPRRREKSRKSEKRDGYHLRDVAIIFGWQAALIGGLTWAIGWWAYAVLWMLPVYLFAYLANLLRSFAEHSMTVSDEEADKTFRLITYRSNWLERQLFAPHNMNLHTAHHLWPRIPYYNLPIADRLIRQSPRRDENMVWRGSYLGYLISYWKEYVRGERAAAPPA